MEEQIEWNNFQVSKGPPSAQPKVIQASSISR